MDRAVFDNQQEPSSESDWRQIVEILRTGLESIPGLGVTGVYVHGSIALGAYDSVRSDIDLVVILEESPDRETRSALRSMHRGLRRQSNQISRFDVLYLFRDHGPDFQRPGPYFRKGKSGESDRLPGVARSILRSRGIAIAGPSVRTIFSSPSQDEIRAEMLYNLRVYWRGRLRHPWLFLSDEMADFALTTLPRIDRTLRTGDVISKGEAIKDLESAREWRDLLDDRRSRLQGAERKLSPVRRALRIMEFVQSYRQRYQ